MRHSMRDGTTTVAARQHQPARQHAARQLACAFLRAEAVLDVDVRHARADARHRPFDCCPSCWSPAGRARSRAAGAETPDDCRAWRPCARPIGLAADVERGRQQRARTHDRRPSPPRHGETARRMPLASVAKRICGPPTAKVENTCSSSGARAAIGSAGMHQDRALAEPRRIGDRRPAEIALGIAAVEGRASGRARADRAARAAPPARPVARLISHFPSSSASSRCDRLRMEAAAAAAVASASAARYSRAVGRTSPTRL